MLGEIDYLNPVNWDHPLNQGLQLWNIVLPNMRGGKKWIDIARRNDGTLTNMDPATDWTSHSHVGGFGSLDFLKASTQYVNCGAIPLDNDNWTVACWFANSLSAITRVFAWHGRGPTIYKDDTGPQAIGIVHHGTIDLAPAGEIGNTGAWHHIAITRSGATARVLIDGIVVAEDTSFAATYTANTEAWIGGSTSFGEHATGKFAAAWLYNRGLSVSEVNLLREGSLRGYPTILNRISSKSYYFVDAGGGSFTIEIDPGTYSITGTAINLEQGSRVEITPGVYQLVGTEIDLNQGYKVDIGLGSYSLTGTDVGLEFGRVVQITPGVYDYEGTDVSLVSGETISLDPGSYSITGTSANLEYGRSLDVELGTYAITGTDLNLEQGYQVDLTPGEYSITGTDVDFSEGFTIRLDTGTYSISPQGIDLIYHRVLSITPGVCTYTGTDVTLVVSGEAIQGGQFIVGQTYIPGFQQAEIYVPRFSQGESFNPGFVQVEVN